MKSKVNIFAIIGIFMICFGVCLIPNNTVFSQETTNWEEFWASVGGDGGDVYSTDNNNNVVVQTDNEFEYTYVAPTIDDYINEDMTLKQKAEALSEAGYDTATIAEAICTDETTCLELTIALKATGAEDSEIRSALLEQGFTVEEVNAALPGTTTNEATAEADITWTDLADTTQGTETGRVQVGYNSDGKIVAQRTLDEDGNVTSRAEYVLDESGNHMLEARHYDGNGNLVDVRTFDTKGNETSRTTYNANGSVNEGASWSKVYEYDGDNVTKVSTYDYSGNLTEYTTTTYDGEDRPLVETEYNAAGGVEQVSTYNYTEGGANGHVVFTNGAGETLGHADFAMDGDGNITEMKVYNATGTVVEHTATTYVNGKVSTVTTYTNQVATQVERYTYNSAGQVTLYQKYSVTNGTETLIEGTEYQYNAQNQLIGQINFKPTAA